MSSRRRTLDRLQNSRSESPLEIEFRPERPTRSGAGAKARTSFLGAAGSPTVRRYVVDPRSGLLSWF